MLVLFSRHLLNEETSLRSVICCRGFCILLIYSRCTGNIIGKKQKAFGPAASRFAIDGDASTCFKAKNGRQRNWRVNLGKNVRVARVFLLLHAKFRWKSTSIDIGKFSSFIIPSFYFYFFFCIFSVVFPFVLFFLIDSF